MLNARTRRAPLATHIVLAALPLWACETERPVALGVTTSRPYIGAARMAVEDALAEGPLSGLDTVLIPQSRNLSGPAIDVARRLVGVEGLIAVVGHSNSAASLAAAPIYNDEEVVQIAPTASAVLYSRVGPYSFRLVPPDDRQGAFLAERLAEAFPGGARVAMVHVSDDYGRGLRSALAANVDPERFPVVLDLPHIEQELEDADISYGVDALGAARPEVIVWLARGGVLARFIAPIREALPDVPIFGSDAVGAGGLDRAPRDVWGDIRYVAYVEMDGTTALRTFQNRYRDRFGRLPTGSDALTYDAVRLVMAGVRAGARTGRDLRAYLASLGRDAPAYAGLTGSLAFDDNGDVERPYVLVAAAGVAGR